MRRVLVVGGGISGLATAWFLRQRGYAAAVLESGAEPGGSIRTVRREGFLVEAGPNSVLYRDGALGELVRGLGLDDELIEANPAAKRRYIAKGGRPVPLPGDPLAFVSTGVFTPAGKLRLLLEPFHRRAAAEESIAQFVRRRLGPQFLDWAIDPFVSGVYAGDPERLSVRAATPKIYALETEYGSLFLGAAARMLRGRPSGPQPTGRLVSFRNGMQTLPGAIARSLGGDFRPGAAVEAIERTPDGWAVRAGDFFGEGQHLVLAVPAYRAAELLAPIDPEGADALGGVRYPPVASVALGFGRTQVAHPLDGFGMLIPGRLACETLGVLFSSTLFPGRAPPDQVLLTAFIGGARHESAGALPEHLLVEHVLADLASLLGLSGQPVFRHVTRWARAIPQYELGHLERVGRVSARVARLPGLHLRANWREGVALGDCVANAKALAETIAGGESR
jgi:oxygen-dependent protoporphyrinogen oxidase